MTTFSSEPSWHREKQAIPAAQSIECSGFIAGDRAFPLNHEQEAAVTELTGYHIINAGAGTGKSRCLCERLHHIAASYPDAAVLMISFTRKAALELKSRIGSIRNCQITTFHSLAYRIMKHNGYQEFRIGSSENARSAIITKLIGKANTTVEEVILSLCRPQAATDTTLVIRKKYLRHLQQNKVMDFDAMQIFALELLMQPRIRNRWQLLYDFVLVDELQDIDTIQEELLQLLTAKNHNLCGVGDSRQSIYSFRGALTNAMNQIAESNHAKVYDLTFNYRCSPGILELANKIMSQDKPLLAKNHTAVPVPPQYLTAKSELAEALAIVKEIQQLHKQGHAYKDMVILYRSATVSRVILTELLAKKIPCVATQYSVFFYNKQPLLGMIRLLRYLLDPENRQLCKNILPVFYLKQNTLKAVMQLSSRQEIPFHAAAKQADVPFFHRNYISRLADALTAARTMTPEQAILHLLHAGYGKYIGKASVPQIDDMAAAAREFPTLHSYLAHIDALRERFEQMRDLASKSDADYVRLMSIHAAKGMEFNTVFLIGAQDGVIPSQHDGIDLEEERRLLYVAVTRAKKRLYISYPLQSENSTEPNQASRFLREAFSMG